IRWSPVVFFFQAEDGIRDWSVTGVQTCALPILRVAVATKRPSAESAASSRKCVLSSAATTGNSLIIRRPATSHRRTELPLVAGKIGRASCRERVEMWVVGVSLMKKKEAYRAETW